MPNRYRLKEDIRHTTRRGDRRIQRSRIPDSNSIATNTFFGRKTATHNTDYRQSGRNNIHNQRVGEHGRRRRKKTMKRYVNYQSRQDTRTGDPNHVTRREQLQSNDKYNYFISKELEQLISKPSTTNPPLRVRTRR